MNTAQQAAVVAMRTLANAGFEAYLVGGCVRDKFMGKTPKDFDVTTNATPDQVASIFDYTIPVGVSFGVVRVLIMSENGTEEIEIATYRADGEYTDGRRPDTVSFSTTVNEDVVRRDFTINGLLEDADGKLLDLVGGLDDLANRRVRAIGDPRKRFEEDSLRMLRAVRFASKFAFEIAPTTLEAIKQLAHTIKRVSPERITKELVQMLSGPQPEVAVRLLVETGLLQEIFPEFTPVAPFIFRTKFRINLTMQKFSSMSNLRPMAGVALLLSELDHKEFETALARLRLSEGEKHTVLLATTLKHSMRRFAETEDAPVKRFLRMPGAAEAMEVFAIESRRGTNKFHSAEELLYHMSLLTDLSPKPLVNGNDLIEAGFKPGPVFTKVLNMLETAQLNGTVDTKEQAMALVKVAIAAASGEMLVKRG